MPWDEGLLPQAQWGSLPFQTSSGEKAVEAEKAEGGAPHPESLPSTARTTVAGRVTSPLGLSLPVCELACLCSVSSHCGSPPGGPGRPSAPP